MGSGSVAVSMMSMRAGLRTSARQWVLLGLLIGLVSGTAMALAAVRAAPRRPSTASLLMSTRRT